MLWGILHGTCVVLERYMMKKDWYEKIPHLIRWLGTFLIVNVGWITFKLPRIKDCRKFLSFLLGKGTPVSYTWLYYLTPRLLTLFTVVIAGTLFSRKCVQNKLLWWDRESKVFNVVKYVCLLVLAYLCFITIISESYTPFLYFQF